MKLKLFIIFLICLYSISVVNASTLILNTGSPTNYSSIACFETVGCTLNSEFIIKNSTWQNLTQYKFYFNTTIANGNRYYIDTYGSYSPNYLIFTLLASGYVEPDIIGSSQYSLSFYEPLDITGYDYINIVLRPYMISYPYPKFGYVEDAIDLYPNSAMWYYYPYNWYFADTTVSYKDIAIEVYANTNSTPAPTPTPPPMTTPTPTPIPTYSPLPTPTYTYTPIPTGTPNANSTNYSIPSPENGNNNSINSSWVEGYKNEINNTISGWNNTIRNGTNIVTNPIKNATALINNVTGYFNATEYTVYFSFLAVFAGALFNNLPVEIIGFITLYLAMVFILLALGR